MTDHHLPALDALEPPDQWDDIVTRACQADGGGPDIVELPTASGGHRHRRWLAAAAVVLVTGAIAAAVALIGPSDAPRSRTAQSAPTADWPVRDEPSAVWGHEWQLVDIQAGDAIEDQQLHVGDGKAIRLDLRKRGRFAIAACNEWAGTVEVRGDVFQVDPSSSATAGCSDPLDDLVGLLLGAPARIDLRGSHLVLTQIPDPRVAGEAARAMGPQLRYTFARLDALTFRQQFWGRAWQVTEVASGDGPWEAVPEGQVSPIDAVTEGRIGLPECGEPWALFDADDLAQQGDWSVWRGSCPYSPEDGHRKLIRSILSGEPDAEVTGSTAVISSEAGRMRARSVPVSTAHQPGRFYDDRWVVVAAYDHGARVALPADLVVKTTPRSSLVTVKACGGQAGGSSSIETDEGGTARLHVSQQAVAPEGRCGPTSANVLPFFEDLFTGEPELHIHGTRASLAIPGKRVVLVQIGPI